VGVEAFALPKIRVRGRSFLALVLAPEPPGPGWFAALDAHLAAAPGFFTGRPVIADLGPLLGGGGSLDEALIVLDGLAERELRLIGVEGVEPAQLAGTCWARLPTILYGHEAPREVKVEAPGDAAVDPPASPAPLAAAEPGPPSLLIDRPVRSGQSIFFEDGDVTVVGSVASGAEVIAGGSIHVYGALRGRAIAGLRAGEAARIFCRKLEAELVAVDRLYRTAEHWGAALHGQAVQIRRDGGVLKLSALD
jgi:septum site-determining protein MinC